MPGVPHRQVALILESGEPFEVAHHVPWIIHGRMKDPGCPKKLLMPCPFGERVDDFLSGPEAGFGALVLPHDIFVAK